MAEDKLESAKEGAAAGPSIVSGTMVVETLHHSNFFANPIETLPTPEVTLHRIRRIVTYEVLETDLEDLDKASRSENQSLAFGSLCAGALLSTIASWIGVTSPTPTVFATYMAGTLVLALATAFFGATWVRERKNRLGVLRRLRTQSVVIEQKRS